MEVYNSHCPDCGAKYQWTGFKTDIGEIEEKLEQMHQNQTICRECGSFELKTELGNYLEMDQMIDLIKVPTTEINKDQQVTPGIGWIQTYMGLAFSYLNPEPQQVSITDIAHALSNTCRYAGHSNQFYSVAQHSVLVSNMLPMKFALYGLLHDAAEAYINDIPSPAKELPELVGFKKLGDKILKVIFNKYGLQDEIPSEVKYVDVRMLLTEKKVLFNTDYKWDLELKFSPYLIEIQPWSPLEAFKAFICLFEELKGM